MADKPITNDTPMADMKETPGNKNTQDQILIQDKSAVRTYKEDTSSTDSNGSPNALKVTPRKKKKKKYRKKQNKTIPDTTKQLKRHSAIESDFSSSDDNITLKELKNDIKRQKDESYSEIESVYDRGGSYKPCRDDYHFSDSNLSFQLSDNSIKTVFYKKPATSKSKKRKRKRNSKKQKLNSDNSLPKNDNSRMNQVEIQNDNLGPTIDQTEDMHMEKAKEISVQEAMNGLVRKRAPADGNCFFQSALPPIHSLLTVQELRRSLCDHIVEKAENYVGFFAAQELSESFEEDITGTGIDLPNHKN